MDFGERLKKLRKGKYSQEELAALLKIHANTISKWESGAMEPRSKRVKQLAQIFNTTSAYLLGETDNSADNSTVDTTLSSDNAPTPAQPKQLLFDFADKALFEGVKSKGMLVYENGSERFLIPATKDGFNFLRELRGMGNNNNIDKTL